jgi:hypothetical protein
MKCVICGTEFQPNKYNPNTSKYCSKKCRGHGDDEHNRQYQRMKRKMWKYLGKPLISPNGNDIYSDLRIIIINGQPRIKGAIALQKWRK